MIETREQYEEWRREYEKGIDSAAEHDAFETIETLREVVRAGQNLRLFRAYIGDGLPERAAEKLWRTLDDLPDWLKDG